MPRGIYKRTPENTTRYWLGKKRGPHSPEWKKKISDGGKGRIVSEETKKKMSDLFMGRKGTYGHLGKKHSQETKDKIRLTKLGSKHTTETKLKMHHSAKKGSLAHAWRGGVTAVNKKVRNSFAYKLWREAIFQRDNWTCTMCSSRSSKNNPVVLNAHHIKSFSNYPELRLEVSNGITLCETCHSITDTYKGRNKKYKNSC